jgi:hypothetical protein
MSVVMDFVANKGLPMQLLLWVVLRTVELPTANLVPSIVGVQHAAPLQENF